jgi:aryl-alcohol dehydrogenase-like predicted oxidoreductase
VDRAVRSARRLGVQQLDLYQMHALNPVIPLTSTMRGMAALQRRGVVAHVGVSNISLTDWERAQDALGGPVLSDQVRYSLAVRGIEQELLPWAQANDRLIIAYSPLAQGLLAGGYGPHNVPVPRRVMVGGTGSERG